MCTIALWFKVWDEAPLVVAANRDELLIRPADVPRERSFGGRRCVAPLDQEAGGTWMGLNDWELFVGITNRFGGPRDPALRSRGDLVASALGAPDVASLLGDSAGLGAERFNPFHLVVAGREGGGIRVWDGAALRALPLKKGVSILTERSFGSEVSDRERRLQEQCAALARAPKAPTAAELGALLAEHAEPGFEGTCVHAEEQGYGTRSSAILRWGAEKGEVSYLATSGPPCAEVHRPWEDLAREIPVPDGLLGEEGADGES